MPARPPWRSTALGPRLHRARTEAGAGIATVHEDVETIQEKNFFTEEELRGAWPDFPRNFCMLAMRPRWLEIVRIGRTQGDAQRWRPQGARLRT